MYGQANSITSTQRSPQETLKSQNRRICGCVVFGDIGCQAAENVVTVYDFHVAILHLLLQRFPQQHCSPGKMGSLPNLYRNQTLRGNRNLCAGIGKVDHRMY